MTKIKICGLKRTEDISYVNELLPDFAGFIFAKSSRQVDAKKAAEQGISFTFIGFLIGIFCGVLILAISPWVIGMYRITSETAAIAAQLMRAVSITVIFMMTGGILTKGILRSGGDTRFLMVADILFLWVFSVPLGAMAGLVWKWPPFWVFFFLRIDNLMKTIICLFRMRSGKWIKKIRGVSH